jgi:twitching motility protein PilT
MAAQPSRQERRVSGEDYRGHFLKLLQKAVQADASDLHLKTGSVPYFRVDGSILPQEGDVLGRETMEGFARVVTNEEQYKQLMKRGEVDLAFHEKGLGRFRVNAFRQRGTLSFVMRRIKSKIPSFDQLDLPHSVLRFAELQRGMCLVTGTTGSGKSTTLASIVDYINQNRRCHIVTIEDPIEYVHPDKLAVVNQREINIDTMDFASALKAVMRQDPDVILVGEMRDVETFGAAISAAETGHLVFSTLHTTNVMQTVDRIIDLFPSNQHDQVRSALATQLKAIMCMRLLPRAGGLGRVPTCEVMFMNSAIKVLIKENRIAQIPMAIQQGAEAGMQSFNDSLHGLIKRGLIAEAVGMEASDNAEELKMMLQGINLSSRRGGILR